MPWNLSMQPIYIVHFPSPKSFMLVNLINSPILLYPFKTDNIVGYSLFLNSLLFLKDSWFWVLSHCLFLLSPCCLLILSEFNMHCPSSVAGFFPFFLHLLFIQPSSAALYAMHSRLNLTPLLSSQSSIQQPGHCYPIL